MGDICYFISISLWKLQARIFLKIEIKIRVLAHKGLGIFRKVTTMVEKNGIAKKMMLGMHTGY